jgi:hypothetical protein
MVDSSVSRLTGVPLQKKSANLFENVNKIFDRKVKNDQT